MFVIKFFKKKSENSRIISTSVKPPPFWPSPPPSSFLKPIADTKLLKIPKLCPLESNKDWITIMPFSVLLNFKKFRFKS